MSCAFDRSDAFERAIPSNEVAERRTSVAGMFGRCGRVWRPIVVVESGFQRAHDVGDLAEIQSEPRPIDGVVEDFPAEVRAQGEIEFFLHDS